MLIQLAVNKSTISLCSEESNRLFTWFFIEQSTTHIGYQELRYKNNEVQRVLILDVVIRKSVVIHKLLAGEDEALLVGGDAFLVLDLCLDGRDCVGALRHEGDVSSCEGSDEDLHAAAQAQLLSEV